MQALLKTKIGPFLVISSVFAVWMLLAVQHVQAHQSGVSAPICSGLPTAADFFDSAANETAGITSSTTTPALTTKKGTSTTGEGNTNYHYAQITIPALAAGELRVFDSRGSGGTAVSAASLCRGGTRIAFYNKSYSSHGLSTHNNSDFTDTHADHAVFQIKAEVSPGDESYIVVVDREDPTVATTISLNVAFHGVIYEDGNNNTISDSFTQRGQQYDYNLNVTADGLLTIQTTGGTDTKGRLNKASITTGSIATADGGGSGGNFKIVVPVVDGDDYTVIVEGQTLNTRGAYTLDLDFKVAVGTVTERNIAVTTGSGALTNVGAPPNWENTAFAADDTMLQLDSRDEDYFFLTIPSGTYELLTIQTQKVSGSNQDPNTKGTLYGPTGEITSDDNSGEANRHFLIETPVGPGNYVVEVTGTAGPYELDFDAEPANKIADVPSVSPTEDDGSTALAIVVPSGSAGLNGYYHALDIQSPGALYVHTTGMTDTVGYLYGPDGRELDDDDDSGSGMNFRLSANVQAGLHLVLVQGKTRMTAGAYSLVVNLVEGEELSGPTTPVDPTDPTCPTDPEPVVTDAEGTFENPSAGGFRSGVGLISGWVCAAEEVEVRIYNSRGNLIRTLDVAYGTSRPDTVGQCNHNSPNTGFGMTYNFNHLPEGEYTIRAYADGTDNQIGMDETFEVVHLTGFEATDRDRFLRLPEDVQARGVCTVNDFPVAGEDTFLKWEQSTQNFVIEDRG